MHMQFAGWRQQTLRIDAGCMSATAAAPTFLLQLFHLCLTQALDLSQLLLGGMRQGLNSMDATLHQLLDVCCRYPTALQNSRQHTPRSMRGRTALWLRYRQVQRQAEGCAVRVVRRGARVSPAAASLAWVQRLLPPPAASPLPPRLPFGLPWARTAVVA